MTNVRIDSGKSSLQTEIEEFKKWLHIKDSIWDEKAAKDDRIDKILRDINSINQEGNKSLSNIIKLEKQQIELMKNYDTLLSAQINARQHIIRAQQLMSDFIIKKGITSKELGDSQASLISAFKTLLTEFHIASKTPLPNIDTCDNYAAEISNQILSLKHYIQKNSELLNKTSEIKSLVNGGVTFLESLLTSIKNSISSLKHTHNSLLKSRNSSSSTKKIEDLENEIKECVKNVIKIKAHLDNNALKNNSQSAPALSDISNNSRHVKENKASDTNQISLATANNQSSTTRVLPTTAYVNSSLAKQDDNKPLIPPRPFFKSLSLAEEKEQPPVYSESQQLLPSHLYGSSATQVTTLKIVTNTNATQNSGMRVK